MAKGLIDVRTDGQISGSRTGYVTSKLHYSMLPCSV